MSIEDVMLARAPTHMLAERAREVVRVEASKGCRPCIANQPLALEPPYVPIRGPEQVGKGNDPIDCVIEQPPPDHEFVRLKVWVSPQQSCDWHRSELFIKQLASIQHRVALEVLGNCKEMAIQLLCHQDDLPEVRTAFDGQFELCELTRVEADRVRQLSPVAWAHSAFADLLPSPPYSHMLTGPDELKRSPYVSVLSTLSEMQPPAMGLYQVVFAPVHPEHDWHQNVAALVDLEFQVRLLSGVASPSRYAQQAPSGDLRQMAMQVESKSHSDKPFFFAAVRMAVVHAGEQTQPLLRSLAVMANLVQHGGRPLSCVTETDYQSRLSSHAIARMFTLGLTHRPGFLVNSWELTSLAHLPPPEILEPHKDALKPLETLPAPESLAAGTLIGYCECADRRQPVCIPDGLRSHHTHLIGRSGTGKSTAVESIVLHDVQEGHGVAVLDPHGTLVRRLLYLLPQGCVDRVIYMDPGDPDWVLRWNPLYCSAGLPPSRVADDLVAAFKSFVTGWGDRLEHLLHHAVFALLHLPGSTLKDVHHLVRKRSEESRRLRPLVVNAVDSETARTFWSQDFDEYGPADISPVQHKLGKLLKGGNVELMVSQGRTSFDLQDVMEQGKILLVDLSSIGSEVRQILGCLILSLLHLTAIRRRHAPGEQLRPFHIFCDEAHRFMTDAMEDLIAETRKFNVSLTLAHQYLSQFGIRKTDALGSVGSAVIFNVDSRDAQYLRKDLRGLVEVEDIITLETGQAIARIGSEVVRIRTPRPREISTTNCRDEIIARCHERYYGPVDEVRRAVRNHNDQWQEPVTPFADDRAQDDAEDEPTRAEAAVRRGQTRGRQDELTYDEF